MSKRLYWQTLSRGMRVTFHGMNAFGAFDSLWHGVYGVTVRLRGREWFIGAIASGRQDSGAEALHP